jgi:hypothetical protein
MRTKSFAVSFVLLTIFALCAIAVLGADMFSGTWKENIARSKHGNGQPPQSDIQKIEAVDNGLRMVDDEVEARAKNCTATLR